MALYATADIWQHKIDARVDVQPLAAMAGASRTSIKIWSLSVCFVPLSIHLILPSSIF